MLAGKDTAYGYIEEYFSDTALRVEHMSFARKLKQSAATLFDIEEDPIVWSDAIKSGGTIYIDWPGGSEAFSGREFLQRYGTEAHRNIFGTDFWVDAALPKDTDHYGKLLVFTDVRFPNEAQRIRDLGGEIWHIVRPSMVNGDDHASEQPLDASLVDRTIINDQTLNHFRSEVFDLLTYGLNMQLGGITEEAPVG